MANDCAGISRPQLDETPVPCDDYSASDCVFMSEDVETGWLGLNDYESLTSYANALLATVKELQRRVEKLEAERNRLVYN